VLSGARKLIYPLQHPKRYIINFTIGLLIVSVVAFFTYTTLALYRFQSTSTFIYRVTQIIPFPIARTGAVFVPYEEYLFALRYNVYYQENQLGIDFDTELGRQQFDDFRRRALDRVVNDAYMRIIADKEGVRVSEAEIDEQVEILRRQSRADDEVLEDVLQRFYDWSLQDLRRVLRQQLLNQKTLAVLDTETTASAEAAIAAVRAGTSFEEVAAQYSEDPLTKDNGGEFDIDITRDNRMLTAQATDALFRLEPGGVSDIVNIGYALQILKTLDRDGGTVRAAHIFFQLEDPATFVNELRAERPIRVYITPPEAPADEEFAPPEDLPAPTQ
jgi:parvulin-like peptidyl-prolyl isomerase